MKKFFTLVAAATMAARSLISMDSYGKSLRWSRCDV
jgi:hypothetical protein